MCYEHYVFLIFHFDFSKKIAYVEILEELKEIIAQETEIQNDIFNYITFRE